jgi:hypothetical protein
MRCRWRAVADVLSLARGRRCAVADVLSLARWARSPMCCR